MLAPANPRFPGRTNTPLVPEAAPLQRGYRLVSDGDPVLATLVGRRTQRTLTRLSPVDLSVAWPEVSPIPSGGAFDVKLGLGDSAPLRAEITGGLTASPTGLGAELGLRLVEPQLTTGRHIVGLLDGLLADGRARAPETHTAIQESIEDSDRIRELCMAMSRDNIHGALRNRAGESRRVRALAWERDPERMTWELLGDAIEGPLEVDGFGFNSIFRIAVEGAAIRDGRLVILLPPQIIRLRNRWRRRVGAHLDSTISFQHPVWPELAIRRPLHDVSYSGLSFKAESWSDLVYPGLEIPKLEILRPGCEPLALSGEVRSISNGGGPGVCGIHLVLDSPTTNMHWTESVNGVLHPRTRIGSEFCSDSWDLFEASGYFKLSGKNPAEFENIKRRFFDVGAKLDGARDVGFRAVWPSQRGVEASISVLKLYSGSWLGHQMAKRPGATPSGHTSKEVLRDIYLRAHETLQSDPAMRWLIGYCEANVRWMDAAHTKFATPYIPSGKACSLPFRLMEASTRVEAWPRVAPTQLSVGMPTDGDIALLLAEIARVRPRAYYESLDLVPERFALAGPRRSWRAANMSLERDVLVVRRNGRPVAAAILEAAERGTNLFYLLDGVRIFPLADDTPEAEQVEHRTMLLRAAAGWYRARSRELFMYFRECDPSDSDTPLVDLGGGRFWVISGDLLPEFLDHIHRLTNPSA